MLKYWSQEERFGLTVAFVFHAILLLILLLIRLDKPEENRSAFIEVDFGQFQFGSPAEFAKEQNKQVQTSKVTSKNKSNEKPIENKPVNEQNTSKSVDKAKPVSAPTQEQNVESEDVVKTPDTEKISPDLTTKQQKREEAVAPDVKKAEDEKKGAEKTGDIERIPQVQPLPSFTEDLEAVITIRFQVRPDGSVGQMIPIKKMNPDLEAEVKKTLSSWRFSRLPSGVPQQPQWGTITFRFVLE